MADTLKPCPFCGGSADRDYRQLYRKIDDGQLNSQAAIYCTNCDAHMTMCQADTHLPAEDRMFILEQQWNTRKEPSNG